MRDDRPSGGSGNPFERRAANGSRPEGMHTRPAAFDDHADEPIDLVAVQADDELVDALASGMAVSAPGRGGYDADDRVVAMLASWRADVESEPIPELVDLDTAVAAVQSTRRPGRARHLVPLAGAAALIVFTIAGVSIGAHTAHPGDTLWGVSKVLYSERAESVESAVEVQTRLENVRSALASGETEVAAEELAMAEAEMATVREEEGLSELAQEQQRLEVKLEETPPGTPTDPDAPTSSPASPSESAEDGAGTEVPTETDPGETTPPSTVPTEPSAPPSTAPPTSSTESAVPPEPADGGAPAGPTTSQSMSSPSDAEGAGTSSATGGPTT